MTPTAESRPDRVALLYEQWRATTLAAGWSFADDWAGPVVESMVRAVTGDEGAGSTAPASCEGVAQELGTYRAESGVGLPEGLRDLAALYEVAKRGDPPFPVARSFSVGWSDSALGTVAAGASTDPLTGFGTPGYLARRLSELEHEASARPRGIEYRALVVRPSPLEGWPGVVQRSAIARVIDGLLDSGEPKGTLPSGDFVGVVTAPTASEYAARMRRRLAEIAEAGYVTIELRAVPTTLAELER